jgi:homopolymeric O-antigen transport system ATP-binding protein
LPMSSKSPAIAIRGVGKKYTIRHDYTAPTTLAEAIVRRVRHPFARVEREQFWALKDVSFDVSQGEALALIGTNGAGKSTLLKILSRITEMSEGEVDVYGRVGSLLEVGTGFNQELTGRENVFLNGAILGMTRSEIRQQFDAIVAFAGVERFLDTPVKHYSSGMYVRLAFAVAAHLRSEILIVDEVLAVGDQEFQRKCLGTMRDVATAGRAVLLVSHNMAAVTSLCTRAVVLRGGRMVFDGEVAEAIDKYSAHDGAALVGNLRSRHDRAGRGEIRSTSIAITRGGVFTRSVPPGEPFEVIVSYEAETALEDVAVSVVIELPDGTPIATLASGFRNEAFSVLAGAGAFVCRVRGLPLRPDTYSINVFLGGNHAFYDLVGKAMSFEISPDDFYGTGKLPQRSQGALLADFRWEAATAAAIPLLAGTAHIAT